MPTDDPAEYFDDLPVLVLQTATLGMVAVCSPKGDEFETVHWRANSIVADACQSCHVTCSYKYRSERICERRSFVTSAVRSLDISKAHVM